MKKSGIIFDDNSKQISAGVPSAVLTVTGATNLDEMRIKLDTVEDGATKTIDNGTTANRPVSPDNYVPYFDTDLGYAVVYNGTEWVNFTNQAGSGDTSGLYYAFNTLSDPTSELTNYAGLDMESIPTGFLTSNIDWFCAIRIATISTRDDAGMAFATSTTPNVGWGWMPKGDYFLRNGSSSYLLPCDWDTPANSYIWVIYQWDDTTSRVDAWVDGIKEIDQKSGFTPGSTQPTAASFLRARYGSAYLNNFMGSVSNIVIGTGSILDQTDVDGLTGGVFTFADLPATVQTKSTNAWSFDATSVVNDKGSISLLPVTDGTGAYELIKQTYSAPAPYLVDGALTVNNDTTGNFDLSSVLVNRGGVAVTYSKVSGDAWFGAPDANTGILVVDADTQTAGDYTAVYRITHSEGTDDMTLTATVTAFATVFSEDFESGIGTWVTLDDSASVNQWELGTADPESGTNSLYVSNDGGTSNTYTNNDACITHIYHTFTTPADVSGGVTMNFDWKCNGESSYDFLRVFITPDTVTPVAGTEVSSAYNILGTTGKYNQSSSWNNETADISAWAPAASTTYKLVLQWKNDGSGGTNPPANIDSISIVA